MKWSWRSIFYWIMLIGSLVTGTMLTQYSLKQWSSQEFSVLSLLDNIEQFFPGPALLFFFFFCFKDRKFYPLKKPGALKKEENPNSKSFGVFYPKIIKISTNIDGKSMTYECGTLSPIRFRATQLNPASDSREEDYDKIFYNSTSGEIVKYDRSRPDHKGLYEHFLWIIEPARKSVLPKSYMEQYTLIESEPDGEKRAETLH